MLFWLLLAVLAAVTAWQWHVTLLYLARLLIDSPYRPFGWSMGTLAAVSRFSILIFGSLWLIYVYYIEYQLREALKRQRLLRRGATYSAVLLALYAVAYLLLR